jgi:carbon storage regulator
MLVLMRKVGETIVIDGDISVTVTAVLGDKVRLGVTASPSVRVDRSEVHERRLASSPEPTRSPRPASEDGTPVTPLSVVVDTNPRSPGQELEPEVRPIGFQAPGAGSAFPNSNREGPTA